MKSILFLMVTAPLFFIGCGTTNPKSVNYKDISPTDLSNVFWVLESLEGEKIVHPEDPREIGFRLDADENKVSGFAGCNNFMGSYSTADSNKIQFSRMASTKMACLTSTFDERILINAFEKIDRYVIDGERLELIAAGEVLATFKKSTKEHSPIIEKNWKLKTLDGKPVKTLDDQEREVYFILKIQDNMLTGYAGCNSFSGSYELKEDNLVEFSKIRSTLRVCPDADFNEHDFLKLFSEPIEYKVDGDSLTFYRNDKSSVATFEAISFN